MTAIVQRYVLVEHVDEGPASDLIAAYPYPEAASAVDLTRARLEAAGGQALQIGRAWAARLQLCTLDEDGVTEGIPLGTHGTATVILTGTQDTVIPARTTVSKSASTDPLWQTGAASAIPHGGTTKSEAVACQEAGPIAAVAHALDTITPAVSGLSAVDNAVDATPGTLAALTLRLLDRRTHCLIHSRSSLLETVDGSGEYQIEADSDQHPLVAAGALLAGNAGRLVIRWAAADDHPPPSGLWDFELVVAHPGGAAVEARGLLEVIQ